MLTHKHYITCTIVLALMTISGALYSSHELEVRIEREEFDENDKNEERDTSNNGNNCHPFLLPYTTWKEWEKQIVRQFDGFWNHVQFAIMRIKQCYIHDEEIYRAKIVDINMNAFDESGTNALFHAIQEKNLNIARTLIENNAEVNKVDNETTPLYLAIQCIDWRNAMHSVTMVKFLRLNGANPHQILNPEGRTPYKRAQMVEFISGDNRLLTAILEVEELMKKPDFDKDTAVKALFEQYHASQEALLC